MKLYPASADVQLEFDKIRELVFEKCRFELARQKARQMRVHTRLSYIEQELKETHEYQQLIRHHIHFPNDLTLSLGRELKLLQIHDAMLSGEELVNIRKLLTSTEGIFRWFDAERRDAYPALAKSLDDLKYEKGIAAMIDEVMDETGQVKDNASDELSSIRMNLYRRRQELRRTFDRLLGKLNKQGYLAEIEESFMNGRRVLAVFAEQKRTVKGILHGESDSRRTCFIEPEETIELNNAVARLEQDEKKEVIRLLRQLTRRLSTHASLLLQYYNVLSHYDFVRAKAAFAQDIMAEYPVLVDKAHVHLVKAVHPLLYLYNKKAGKETIPVDVTLDAQARILVISGPNAGGKTVTLKTIGLLQLMVQSGLLVPVHPASQFGIFRQLMIHIGDTQSLEFELSTYSSHLLSMKHFIEHANGKTLFFIDELGSGSDPNLGGAFAEVILEELAKKHALGVVTTHYLNLKVMAGKTAGIVNGAMAFDEKNLLPQYRLVTGKPGSSYTFSIAERIGLDKRLIQRARSLVDADHFRLDKLLNRTEQDLQKVEAKEKELQRLLKENEKLKREMEQVMDREKHRQQVELLKQQNKITEDRLAYLKEMERKLKQVVIDWRKSEDKNKVIKEMASLLFKKNDQKIVSKKKKQLDEKFREIPGDIAIGDRVKMRKNMQVGSVLEIRGKKALVKIGLLPMQISLADLVKIEEKAS